MSEVLARSQKLRENMSLQNLFELISGDEDRVAARFRDTQLHGFGYLVEIHVPGDNLVVGADDSDKRLLHLLLRHAEGVPERTVRGLLKPLLDGITSHSVLSSFLKHIN